MTLEPGVIVGPYRLGRLLGRGGMAVVYEARNESIGRTVALKLVSPDLIDPEFVERFRHEGRMQAALDHPHAVRVYEAGTSEHGPWLAMRLVRGTTLAGLIDDGVLDSSRALDLLKQVAGALDAAHAAGLVHRDIKPRNVLVEDADQAFLADFGLTRTSEQGGATATGRFMATVAYAAPEVISGAEAGPAADRYALAVVLFECLTGSTVFPRPTTTAILYAHTTEPPPRVSGRRLEAPRALDEALMAGLAKDPSARPATATELIRRARAALGDTVLEPPAPRLVQRSQHETDTAAPGTATVPPRSGPYRRGRAAVVAAAVAGLLVGGGAVALLTGDDGTDPTPAVASPSPPPGTDRLGPELAAAGRTLDCEGKPVTEDSVNCTIFQDRLAQQDTPLVATKDGAVVRWGVRDAVGELALAVLRRDGDEYFQIARSRTEFVYSPGPHFFETDLLIEQGDRLGLVLVPGSGVGIRAADGASTGLFIPSVGFGEPPEAGTDGELLLTADYKPGRQPPEPPKLLGARAAAAPDGKVIARRGSRFPDGTPIEVLVVGLDDGRGVLDVVYEGSRQARIGIPDFSAEESSVLRIETLPLPPARRQFGMGVLFRQADSQRLLERYYQVLGRRVEFAN